jgi:outer membrane immunogenic protein
MFRQSVTEMSQQPVPRSDTFESPIFDLGQLMKKLLEAAVVLVAFSAATAHAADLPSVKGPPVYTPPPAPAWTGFYIGVNAGGAWNADPVGVAGSPLFANPLSPAGSAASLAASVLGVTRNLPVNSKGFFGGAQIGYNRQFDKFVLGVEADIQGTSVSGSGYGTSTEPIVGFPGNTAQTTLSVSNRLDYLGTLRGRIGFTITPALLIYGTGGLAYGGVNSKTDIDQALAGPGTPTVNFPYSSNSNFSSTRFGWTAGAGLAWMLSPQWSVKLEYLYYDLGSANYGAVLNNIVGPPGGVVPTGATFYSVGATASTRFDGNIVRVGLNYQFD